MFLQLIFCLDAGIKKGLGHLSRCLSLAEEFIPEFTKLHFIIRTDNEKILLNYLKNRNIDKELNRFIFLRDYSDSKYEFGYLKKYIKTINTILILDHYRANEPYQKQLQSFNVKWIQFDSHAKTNFYANIVLHASPTATFELYQPLIKNNNTKLLLGTKYAIINKKFREKIDKVQVREKVKNIFICFGGGDDHGATLKILNLISTDFIHQINLHVFVSSKNSDLTKLQSIVKCKKNTILISDCFNLADKMISCDLGIITPGTLSYEAAFMGLPMLLVSVADNQKLNSIGWEKVGCAISLGEIEHLNSNKLNINLAALINNTEKIKSMSEKCLQNVDGLGAKRVKKEIELLV